MTKALSFKFTRSASIEEALNKITLETMVKYRSNDHSVSPALITQKSYQITIPLPSLSSLKSECMRLN